MRNFLLLALLVLIVSGAALAGDISVAITKPSAVLETTQLDFVTWANDPINATGCAGGDCCVAPADDAKCIQMAREVIDGNADAATRNLFVCLQVNVNYACDVAVVNGRQEMYCETIPGTDTVRLTAVAICASELAAVLF